MSKDKDGVPRNAFLTLTYNDDQIPEDHGLVVKHWQDFAKKLRHHWGAFRFMHCGEYGDLNFRPHYHALIFGHDFHQDSVTLKGSASSHPLKASASIAEMWDHGFHSIGQVTFDSAAYVASYCTKKITGDQAEQAYTRIDKDTGEVWVVPPEYATMSRRPGLGTSWFEKYWKDVYPDNFVILNGQKVKPPAFYDKLLEKNNPQLAKEMKNQRKKKIKKQTFNYTPDRLRVREQVLKAKTISRKKQHGISI